MRITCWLFNYDIKCENFASMVLSHRNELWFLLKDPVLWAFCSFVSWSCPSLLEFFWKRNFRSMDFHDRETQRQESHTASDCWGNNLSKQRASKNIVLYQVMRAFPHICCGRKNKKMIFSKQWPRLLLPHKLYPRLTSQEVYHFTQPHPSKQTKVKTLPSPAEITDQRL